MTAVAGYDMMKWYRRNGPSFFERQAKLEEITDKNLEMAHRIAVMVSAAGGRAYFVGGFVRDQILNRPSKDIDLEIHGISPQVLQDILEQCGERTVQGAAFPVYGIRHYDIDIAMPRVSDCSGASVAAPFIGTEKAALRRDLTINALMQDVLSGEILDYFGGLGDLKNGVLRHVNPQTFSEDPLRVLRTAQFAARFHFRISEDTIALCSTLNVSELPKERVLVEVQKAFQKGERPSVFFEALREMNQLHTWFPELEALIGVPQDPEHHPEGDAWTHTMLVLDAAASLCGVAKNPTGLMFSALCHDFGKAVTTQMFNGHYHAYRHEIEGIPLAKQFIQRLTDEIDLKRYVSNMVALHMRPNMLVSQNSGRKAMMRLFDEAFSPEDLLLLSKADRMGQLRWEDCEKKEAILRQYLEEYHQLLKRPSVQGADLIAAGFEPGPELGAALKYARKLHLSGVKKKQALKATISYLKKRKADGLPAETD